LADGDEEWISELNQKYLKEQEINETLKNLDFTKFFEKDYGKKMNILKDTIINENLIENLCHDATDDIIDPKYKEERLMSCENKISKNVSNPLWFKDLWWRSENFNKIMEDEGREIETKEFVKAYFKQELEGEGFFDETNYVRIPKSKLYTREKLKAQMKAFLADRNDDVNTALKKERITEDDIKKYFKNKNLEYKEGKLNNIVDKIFEDKKWVEKTTDRVNRYLHLSKYGCTVGFFKENKDQDEAACENNQNNELIFQFALDKILKEIKFESEKKQVSGPPTLFEKYAAKLLAPESIKSLTEQVCNSEFHEIKNKTILKQYENLCINKIESVIDTNWINKNRKRVELFIKTTLRDYNDNWGELSEGFVKRLLWHELQKEKQNIEIESGFDLDAFFRSNEPDLEQYSEAIDNSCSDMAMMKALKNFDLGSQEIIKILKKYGPMDSVKSILKKSTYLRAARAISNRIKKLAGAGYVKFTQKKSNSPISNITLSGKLENELDLEALQHCQTKLKDNLTDEKFLDKLLFNQENILRMVNNDILSEIPDSDSGNIERLKELVEDRREKWVEKINQKLFELEAAKKFPVGDKTILESYLGSQSATLKGRYYGDKINIITGVLDGIERKNVLLAQNSQLRSIVENNTSLTWNNILKGLKYIPSKHSIQYTKNHPDTYYADVWKFLDNTGLHNLPGKSFIEDPSYGGEFKKIYNSAHRVFGGWSKIRGDLGLPQIRFERVKTFPAAMVKTWNLMDENSWNNIPTSTVFQGIDPILFGNLYGDFLINYKGFGLPELRRALNYSNISHKAPKYYENPANFYPEMWYIIDLNKGMFPSLTDLKKFKKTRILIPINNLYGGYLTLRNKMGFEIPEKSVYNGYSQYKGKITEEYLVPLIYEAALHNGYDISPLKQTPVPIKTNGGVKNRQIEIYFTSPDGKKYGSDITANNNFNSIIEQKIGESDGYHKGLDRLNILSVTNSFGQEKIDNWRGRPPIPENVDWVHYKEINPHPDTVPFYSELFKNPRFKIPDKIGDILDVIAASNPQLGREKLEADIQKIEDKHAKEKEKKSEQGSE